MPHVKLETSVGGSVRTLKPTGEGVDFGAADNPGADRMMLQNLSVFAEYNARALTR